MKKFVAIILVVLPIFLLVSISIAGMVLSQIVFINVESVTFVDDLDKSIANLKIARGDEYQLLYKILPQQATNKKVSFSSSKEEVVSITESGEIEGLEYGFATIIITTADRSMMSQILIQVTDEKVESITLSHKELTLTIGKRTLLVSTILPTTALNKNRTWESSDEAIATVNAAGEVRALSEGTAIITVTTEEGGKTDECEVTVVQEDASQIISFKAPPGGGDTWRLDSSDSIDLRDVIKYTDGVNFEDITFKITAGETYATLSGGILTFNKKLSLVKVYASVTFNGQFDWDDIFFVWL